MKIYYYHTRPIEEALTEWKDYKHPGHILYGLPLFQKHGIECILHYYKNIPNRFNLAFQTAWSILTCKESYDLLYGTSFRGLELIIFLRALGIYQKPIAIWHHTAITTSKKKWKETISRFFYKGIDKMFFFSNKLIKDSVQTGKAPINKMELIHWGPDLAFYDQLLLCTKEKKCGFISTGKENRDMTTLLKAFSASQEELSVYISPSCGELHYQSIISALDLPSSIHIHYTNGIIPYELAKIVAQKKCIVICCLDFPYTVGLTTLVEALALGIPVICSRNPNFEIDIDKENIGITVEYNNVQGWINAIDYISSQPDVVEQMGKNARKLAEEKFNLEIFTQELAESFQKMNLK